MPAASELLAESWVVASPGTGTVIPAPASWAGVPVTGVPVQFEVVNTRTEVAPPPALPCTSGLLSLAGEAGEVPVRLGAEGAVESSV